MQTEALIIIALVLAAIAGYTAFIALRRDRAAREGGLVARPQGGAIPDSPTYRRTKDNVAALRSDLDRFSESLDLLTHAAIHFNSDAIKAHAVFREEIPLMHQALVAARNHAEGLLAAVQQRVSEPPLDLEFYGDELHLDVEEIVDDNRGAAARTQRYLRELREAVEGVGPGLAGFYFALTESSERHQVNGATRQARKVLGRLDYAIDLMVAFEKELLP